MDEPPDLLVPLDPLEPPEAPPAIPLPPLPLLPPLLLPLLDPPLEPPDPWAEVAFFFADEVEAFLADDPDLPEADPDLAEAL